MAWRNIDIDQLLIADLVERDLRSASPNRHHVDTDLALTPRTDQSPAPADRGGVEDRPRPPSGGRAMDRWKEGWVRFQVLLACRRGASR